MTTEKERDFVRLLQCPVSGETLRWAGESDVARIRSQAGVGTDDEAFLITSSGDRAYLFKDSIFRLLPSEGIDVTTHSQPITAPSETTQVQAFYEEVGWSVAEDSDNYEDAVAFEDLRPVSADYIRRCHLRLNRHLPKEGRFIIDAASGPVQYKEYEAYSAGFETRICVDLSLRALKEARKRLGEHAICIQGDLASLPLRSGVCDAAISLHTIYHMPPENQVRAFTELQRVAHTGAPIVIVYSWGTHSFAMRAASFPARIWRSFSRTATPAKESPYYHPLPPRSLLPILKTLGFDVIVWRSVSVPFLKAAIHQKLAGRLILAGLFRLEEWFPRLAGKLGAYPLLVGAGRSAGPSE